MNSIDNTPVDKKADRMSNRGNPSQRLFILFAMFVLCSLFYYFGELIDWAAWDALRNSFFYGVHDIHRLLFLVPVLYAAHVFGTKATVIISIITLMTFLPRAMFISPYPDPLLRMVLFTVIAGTLGYLVALVRKKTRRCEYLESLLMKEKSGTETGGEK